MPKTITIELTPELEAAMAQLSDVSPVSWDDELIDYAGEVVWAFQQAMEEQDEEFNAMMASMSDEDLKETFKTYE